MTKVSIYIILVLSLTVVLGLAALFLAGAAGFVPIQS